MKKPDCAWNLADLKEMPQNGLRVFTTFSCGGGSSMGYKLAGCDVIGANDIDQEMAYHYKLNLNPKNYFLMPVKDLINTPLPKEFENLDILDGSPPCSTFSMAGSREKAWGKDKHFREGQAKQVLSDLFFDYLDVAEFLRPKVIIAENVKGMILGNAKGYVKLVFQRLKDIGYKPQLFLLNAADCGVPQKRERVFFCALRDDIVKPGIVLAPKHRWISAGEAVSDLQVLTDAEKKDCNVTESALKYWHKTKQGDSFSKVATKEKGMASHFNWVRLSKTEPSSTLPAEHAKIHHFSECRPLTYREWKRLGSFPDDYKAKTDKIGKYMVGMSVPPKMAAYVAKEVIRQWLD